MSESHLEGTVDSAEIEKFSKMAQEWWDPQGKFRPLHKFNPIRLFYLKQKICQHFERDPLAASPLQGLRILDIGCGGGLLCEPMARMGAEIVGVDASERNIAIATMHAQKSGLVIDYRADTAEALQAQQEKFDIVLNMEVVEHVADVHLFMQSCCALVQENGLMFVATINRTLKAWALAIIGAEYILRWLPQGTHQYEKLVKPEELKAELQQANFMICDQTGIVYNPLQDIWRLSPDIDVNYMLCASKVKVESEENARL